MTEAEDSLTSKMILSAREGTVNPVSARSKGSDASPSRTTSSPRRLDKLVRTLRNRAQSLADGGVRFHEVFDSLDAHDTGEISGSKSVLTGLHSLGIKNATAEDADALLDAFEGSRPGRMSYKKFLKAVMLGNSSKERVSSIIADIQWQLSNCDDGDEDSHGDALRVITNCLAEGDEDGSGTIGRSSFRDSLQTAFLKVGMRGIEEGDLRRLMDRFERDGNDVSYVDFVKVLRSDVCVSPKKGPLSPLGGAAGSSFALSPLSVRVTERLAAQNMDAIMLREAFLPRDVMGPTETIITFSEVETVFAVDLGITLDPSDEKEIMNNFGVSHDSVDVKAMLEKWGLWEDTAGVEDTTHLADWSTTMPKKSRFAASKSTTTQSPPHNVPSLPIETLRMHDGSSIHPASDNEQAILQQYRQQQQRRQQALQPPNVDLSISPPEPAEQHQSLGKWSHPVESQVQENTASSAAVARLHQQQQHSAPSSTLRDAPPLIQDFGAEPKNADYIRTLQKENEKLKSELSSFDLDFFEEIEDLKHNYERLKKVALSQTNAPPGAAAGDKALIQSMESIQEADPFDSAPQKQMMEMLDRAGRLAGGLGVPLSPRQNAMFLNKRKKKKKKKNYQYGNDYDHWNARGGVVGAHERKLAWQISGGGFEALEEADKWIKRMDRSGDGYLSGKQVAAALREAGYDLTDSDVQVVLNGFGSDKYGRVDVAEFTQALNDIASGNDWYQQDYKIPTEKHIPPQSLDKSGEFMYGTSFNGLQTGYEGLWDGFDAGRESDLVEAALKEVMEQISLIDISRLPGYGSGNRAAAIMRPFKMLDKGNRGIVGIREFSGKYKRCPGQSS